MMTMAQVCELVHLMKKNGIECQEGDEVGLMRAKKFYRHLGWRDDLDFFFLDGKVYFNVDCERTEVTDAQAD